MNKVFRKIKSFFYALPFGLKAADSEIMGASNAVEEGVSINQNVSQDSVYEHLLKGEVTQEVEELRHANYKIAREADNYSYAGGGVGIKKKRKYSNGVIKFSQENKSICTDILTELKRVNNFGTESYTVSLGYEGIPKIKFEQFITTFDVYIDTNVNKAHTTLHFSSISNPSIFSSKPFVASLNALYDAYKKGDMVAMNRSDFKSLSCMNFVTYNTNGNEVDVVNYSFLNGELDKIELNDTEFELTYVWKDYVRLDLTEKFHSKTMEEKYKNKERKKDFIPSVMPNINVDKNVIYCATCGKEIDALNGDLPFANNGKIVCQDCYNKSLQKILKR